MPRRRNHPLLTPIIPIIRLVIPHGPRMLIIAHIHPLLIANIRRHVLPAVGAGVHFFAACFLFLGSVGFFFGGGMELESFAEAVMVSSGDG
jgi:hypothetical protein